MNLNIQDLAAIIVPLGALMYLLWKKINKLEEKCATKEDLSAVKTDISNLTNNVIEISRHLGIIQGQLMPKVVPLQEEQPKKKAKGE